MKQHDTKIKHEKRTLFAVPLLFMAVCAIIQLSDGLNWANLQVEATLSGEYWRLLTGHLVHADWPHYGMNMAGLGLCVAVYYRDISWKDWLGSVVALSLFSSAGLLYLYEPYQSYVGFSDVLHGWIMMGCFAIYATEKKLAVIVFVLFWIKIIEENLSLPFFTSFGVSGNVAKESHILGAVGGIVYSLVRFSSFRTAFMLDIKKLSSNSAA